MQMFDYTVAHWSTFFIAAILLNLSPGPDMAFILAQSARNGQRSGFAAMFGIWSGAFLHVVLAAIGLSALLVTSATAFTFVKWIGATYLIFLGIQAFRSDGSTYSPDKDVKQASNMKIFQQGVLVAALNPKVAIFFLAFLPQFVVDGAGPAGAQLFLHGSLIIVVAAFIEPPFGYHGCEINQISQSKLSGGSLDGPRVGHTIYCSWRSPGFERAAVNSNVPHSICKQSDPAKPRR